MAALVLPLALVSACGDDTTSTADDPAPSGSPAPSESAIEPTEATSEPAPVDNSPQCSDIWVDGETFVAGYKGCFDGDSKVKVEARYCEFGTRLFTYADAFYAVPNGRINEVEGSLADSESYQTALNKCGG